MSQNITAQTVEHIARLARLKMNAADIERYQMDLSAILDYVAQLDEIDTTDIEPTAHPSSRHSVLRDDQTAEGLQPETALSNAPQSDDSFFIVPKVLDSERAE